MGFSREREREIEYLAFEARPLTKRCMVIGLQSRVVTTHERETVSLDRKRECVCVGKQRRV